MSTLRVNHIEPRTADSVLELVGTQGVRVPAGTTAERPTSPAAGTLRYNTTSQSYEGFSNGQWSSLAGNNGPTVGLTQVESGPTLSGVGTQADPLNVDIAAVIAAGALLTAVASDNTLTGDGTAANPLSVNIAAIPTTNGLLAVNRNNTLIGDGTSANALGVSIPDIAPLVANQLNYNTLLGRVTTLETDSATASTNILQLQTQTTSLSTNLAALTGRVEDAETDITQLQTQTTSLSTNLTTLTGQVTTAQNNITQLQNNKLSTVATNSTLTGNGTTSSPLGVDIAALQAQLDSRFEALAITANRALQASDAGRNLIVSGGVTNLTIPASHPFADGEVFIVSNRNTSSTVSISNAWNNEPVQLPPNYATLFVSNGTTIQALITPRLLQIGDVRYDSVNAQLEFFNGTVWQPVP